MRRAPVAALLLAMATTPAGAQAVHGFYLQGNTGIFFQKPQPFDATQAAPAAAAHPGAAAQANAAIGGAPALSESSSLGYGFGRGLRVEVEALHGSGSPGGS